MERDYYLGNYQSCINKANAIPPSRESIFYMSLSDCHLKCLVNRQDNFKLELETIGDEAGKLLKIFVDYVRDKRNKNELIKELNSIIEDGVLQEDDELSRLVASAIYARHKDYANALKVIDRFDSEVATYSKILVLIMMNRGDLAEKKLSVMTNKYEQSPLTELAQAQVLLVNKNASNAWRIAGSLADRFKPTPLLYNLQTAAAISLGEYNFAKELCEGSLDMDNDNLEALINMVHILSKLKSSPAIINRYLNRLTDLYEDNDFVKGLNQISIDLGV